MSLDAVVDWLTCPVCVSGLSLAGGQLACQNRHSFDVAHSGYVNLLGSRPPKNADTPAMIAARDRYLSGGYYAPIADAVSTAVAGCRAIIEAGAGTGYYLGRALTRASGGGAAGRVLSDGVPVGLGLDVSVPAAKAMSRAGLAAVVADVWRPWPVRSALADAVISVFAPKNVAEFGRVLRPGGLLVTVVPTAQHLAELRAQFGLLDVDADKVSRLVRELDGPFSLLSDIVVEYPLSLSPAAVADLIGMGPNAFHAQRQEPIAITTQVSVQVLTFRRCA